MCVRSRHLLKSFAAEAGVPLKPLGKLIVATSEAEIPAMRALAATAHANGVDDLVEISGEDARAMEPAMRAVAALHSPSTGIVDAQALMLALEGALTNAGGQVVLSTEVASIAPIEGGYELAFGGEQAGEVLTAANLMLAAGHDGPELAQGFAHANYTPPIGYLRERQLFRARR